MSLRPKFVLAVLVPICIPVVANADYQVFRFGHFLPNSSQITAYLTVETKAGGYDLTVEGYEVPPPCFPHPTEDGGCAGYDPVVYPVMRVGFRLPGVNPETVKLGEGWVHDPTPWNSPFGVMPGHFRYTREDTVDWRFRAEIPFPEVPVSSIIPPHDTPGFWFVASFQTNEGTVGAIGNPEPSTLLLGVLGVVGGFAFTRRRLRISRQRSA